MPGAWTFYPASSVRSMRNLLSLAVVLVLFLLTFDARELLTSVFDRFF